MASTKDVIYKQHTQHGVDPVHRYCMGVAGLGYSIDTGTMATPVRGLHSLKRLTMTGDI